MLGSQVARPAPRTLPTCPAALGGGASLGSAHPGAAPQRFRDTGCSSQACTDVAVSRDLPSNHVNPGLLGAYCSPQGPRGRRSLSPSVAAAGLWAPTGLDRERRALCERHQVQRWPLPLP